MENQKSDQALEIKTNMSDEEKAEFRAEMIELEKLITEENHA